MLVGKYIEPTFGIPDIQKFLDVNSDFEFDIRESLQAMNANSLLKKTMGFYRDSVTGDNTSIALLRKESLHANLLSRSDIQKHNLQYVRPLHNQTLYRKRTSGRTDKSIHVYYSPEFYLEEKYLSIRKIAFSANVKTIGRSVYSISLVPGKTWPNLVFLDPLQETGLMLRVHIDERNANSIKKVLKLIKTLRPEVIVSKPALLEAVVKSYSFWPELFYDEANLVVSSGGMLTTDTRELISKIYSCPVVNAYALSEFGLVASECLFQNGLHVDTSSFYSEILPVSANPVKDNLVLDGTGELILSSFRNASMPLHRYRTGDKVQLEVSEKCVCGNAQPLLDIIDGKWSFSFSFTNGSFFDASRFSAGFFNEPFLSDWSVSSDENDMITLEISLEDKCRQLRQIVYKRIEVRAKAIIPEGVMLKVMEMKG